MSTSRKLNGRGVTERLEEPTRPTNGSGSSQQHQPSGHFKALSLALVNAAEDIPRLIRAFGKVGRGECAIVLRPHEGQALIVHAENGEAWHWTGADSDVVRRPETPISIKDSIALIRQAQRSVGVQGPISLKGQWKGKLLCDNGLPRVTLERKIAAYGTLHIQSDASSGKWTWHIDRTEKWFTPSGEKKGSARTLVEAIRNGLASAMGLLGEACSVRDSRRRAAMDPSYAQAHPIRPAAEKTDPTEKYNPKEKKPRAEKTPRAPKAEKTPQQPKTDAAGKTPKTAKTTADTKQPAAPRKSKATPAAPTTKPAGAADNTKAVGSGKAAGNGNGAGNGTGSGNGAGQDSATPTRRGRGKKASQSQPGATAAPAAAPPPAQAGAALEIDPAKDKMLLDAFSAAVAQAIAQMQ